jgi:uncharacterized RDD family membrane protein YckC
MTGQILDAPSSPERRLRYAGFWIRFAAILIDFILLSIVYYAVLFAVLGGLSNPDFSSIGLVFIIILFMYLLYFPLMESSARQATFGKMAVGIKVGNAEGERISFLNALGRYFAKIPSAIILYVGFMMAGWDSKKQALHDKIADTYVFEV